MPPRRPPPPASRPSNGESPAASVEQATAGALETPAATPTATPTPSASSTPAPVARMTPGRGRGKPTVAPKFAGRRNAAERQALAAAEAKKKAAEAEAAAAQAKQHAREARRFGYRGNDRGRGAGRGRGRGGHMGDAHRQKEEVVASGPFSAGQVGADPKAAYNRRFAAGGASSGVFGGGGGAGGSSSGGGGGGGSSGSGIKRESGMGGDYSGMRPPKGEDGGYISSDAEDADPTLPKQDIDQMQVIDLTGDDAKPKQTDAFAPVRLTRVPHKDRTVGLSADDAVAVDSSDSAEPPITDKKKGKQREKDVEITGSKHNIRPAAYSSSDSETEPHIKPEPQDDEHQMRPTTPIPVEGDGITTIPISDSMQDPPSSPETKRKAKERIKAIAEAIDDGDESDVPLPEPPRFQTQAELDEWKRHYKDLKNVRNELGRQLPKGAAIPDGDGDVTMSETGMSRLSLEKAQLQENARSQHVYLFQFPPVLPSLVPVSVKPDPEAAPADHADEMDVDPAAGAEREKETANNSKKKPSTSSLNLPSGLVGKLRIHKSGKATLDWGGTPYVLNMGADATFLQNVLIAQIPETKPIPDAPTDSNSAAEAARIKKEAEEKEKEMQGEPEIGTALGMGQVRGKFVLTPDWDQIL